MTSDKVGIIADDFTGATDIGGLLARTRADVTLHTGPPGPDALAGDGVHVIALKIRTIPVTEACDQARDALSRLQAAGATRIYWKYCSTFDSTDRGNIGPVAEALMAVLTAPYTLYCPAFPENGRVVRDSTLFVNGVPLAESPMKDHPLTPRRDGDLVNVLTPQVTRPVARLAASRAETGAEAASGIAHFIADAADWDDLIRLGQDYGDLPFLTGGSAFAAAAYGAPDRKPAQRTPVPRTVSDGPALIISGSCSSATQAQVAQNEQSGGAVIRLDPLARTTAGNEDLIAEVIARRGSEPVLLTSPDWVRHWQICPARPRPPFRQATVRSWPGPRWKRLFMQ